MGTEAKEHSQRCPSPKALLIPLSASDLCYLLDLKTARPSFPQDWGESDLCTSHPPAPPRVPAWPLPWEQAHSTASTALPEHFHWLPATALLEHFHQQPLPPQWGTFATTPNGALLLAAWKHLVSPNPPKLSQCSISRNEKTKLWAWSQPCWVRAHSPGEPS